MVGTTNRSMAAMSGAWLCRKVRHPWLGGPRRLTMYLATLDCATSNPSLSSSPWMRGAPQSGFSMLIRRISARSSVSIIAAGALKPGALQRSAHFRLADARCACGDKPRATGCSLGLNVGGQLWDNPCLLARVIAVPHLQFAAVRELVWRITSKHLPAPLLILLSQKNF
jgi:hypothetical protein